MFRNDGATKPRPGLAVRCGARRKVAPAGRRTFGISRPPWAVLRNTSFPVRVRRSHTAGLSITSMMRSAACAASFGGKYKAASRQTSRKNPRSVVTIGTPMAIASGYVARKALQHRRQKADVATIVEVGAFGHRDGSDVLNARGDAYACAESRIALNTGSFSSIVVTNSKSNRGRLVATSLATSGTMSTRLCLCGAAKHRMRIRSPDAG